ncbi:MAG: HlyC/CorC family transporter [Kineosporiaceae bacterium]|nr:HlyC/CorC family transporter [Kineosporiaceae bacterium]
MGETAIELVLVVVLIAVNALFSGSEMALVTLREGQLRRLARESPRGARLARLARDPSRFLATIQIGITLAGFLASAAAAVSLSEPLVGLLAITGPAAEVLAVMLVTLVLTFITLVLGELAPKRVALQRAESWALAVAGLVDGLATVSRPAVWLVATTSDLVVRLFGVDPRAPREEVSVEEIRDLIAARREFSDEQRTIISGAFEITERTLREILIPRGEVVSIAGAAQVEQALQLLVSTGRSRLPVTGPTGFDTVIGVVHFLDLYGDEGPVSEHVREALFLPETLLVSEALRQMRQAHQHFAVVVDEHGANDGIVTLEDLVEEIIGEIYDELDRDVAAVIHEPDGSMLVPGSFPIHDLPDLGVHVGLPDDVPFTTVSGLIMDRLQRIPGRPGETVEVDGYCFEVLDVAGHTATRIRVRPTLTTSAP